MNEKKIYTEHIIIKWKKKGGARVKQEKKTTSYCWFSLQRNVARLWINYSPFGKCGCTLPPRIYIEFFKAYL